LRSISLCLSVCLLSSFAAATDLKVRVVDPRSAAVAGAQVALLDRSGSAALDVQNTSADGTAVLRSSVTTPLRVRVLAPGFASHEVDVNPGGELLTVQLRLATQVETVVISSTLSPLPEEESGSNVSTLDHAQLTVMNPVAANDALRFLPGAVMNVQGQRGALSSLFVRGGDSRYNKVMVDGVPVSDPGGTFDFGVVPLQEVGRLEFLRGAQSTLYGSDAMTSVVQTWTREGSTPTPELVFGAEGGNFNTAQGYIAVSGARGRYDYNLFGRQFNTTGQGMNSGYSNSSQGGNVGVQLTPQALFRVRAQHSNSRTGVAGEWNFNGASIFPPDSDQWARQNNLLASAELTLTGPTRWQHRFRGFEYHHKRVNVDSFVDPGREFFDFPTDAIADINRAGFDYQGSYVERGWAQTTFGYQFEDENGFVGDLGFPPITHGLRRNQAVYGQQTLALGRLSVIAGARFVHNTTFGNTGVPRVAVAWQLLRGGELFSGTRVRFSYATGIKAPRFEEAFARGQGIIPNPTLQAEENRAFEAGFEQNLLAGKYALSGTYYNNLFRHQIDFAILDPTTFTGKYENINKSMAHGAEVEFQGRPVSRLSFTLAYNYASTKILEQPFAFDPLHLPGQPLLRRPRHSGSFLLNYIAKRWGGNLGVTAVGRRADSDFVGLNIEHAAGYARVDFGGFFSMTSRITAYVNVENALNKYYNEVVGYPALTANFRAGLRFRLGGE
jgi:vitamin B12 transporter